MNRQIYIDLKDHFVFNESFREQAERMESIIIGRAQSKD